MRKTRFTDERMVRILREGDKASVPEVAKKHGVRLQVAMRASAGSRRAEGRALLSVARPSACYAWKREVTDSPADKRMRRARGAVPAAWVLRHSHLRGA